MRAHGTTDAHLDAIRQLALAADVALLTAAPIDFFMVKGPVLAAVYPRPEDRRYRDLDVVVAPHAVDAAIRAVSALGGQLLDANWDAALRDRWGQVHLRMPHGTMVDLHWHLVNMGRTRDTLAVDMQDAWRDLRTVEVPGGSVQTLSVTNTVVHVAMHAALGGAWQARWFSDIQAFTRAHDIDWADVVERAKSWRVGRLVGVALLRAATLGDATVPADVIRRLLACPLARTLVVGIDRMWPPTAASHDWSPARLWPHLLRDSALDTVRAAAWRIERRTRNGVRGFWHGRTMPHEMVPSGTDATRQRYFELVAAGALT